jgi:hypothetical protein
MLVSVSLHLFSHCRASVAFGLMFFQLVWFGAEGGHLQLAKQTDIFAILDREETAETATAPAYQIQNTNKELDDDPARVTRKGERKSSSIINPISHCPGHI